MPPLLRPFQQPIDKPKSCGKLRKRTCVENKAKHDSFVKVEALDKSTIRTENQHNLVQKLRTDLGGILGKNLLSERLVKPMHEFAKSVTETSSKMQESKTYNKAINNPIHRNRWQEVIDKEL